MGDADTVGRMMKPIGAKDGTERKPGVSAAVAQQCLWSAARSGNVAMLQYWLDAGADPTVQPGTMKADYWSGLSILANGLSSGNADMVRKLLDYKMDLHQRVQNEPLLSFALHRSGKMTAEIVELLVKAGADVNARGNYGQTPIFVAAPEAVKPLLAGGADINARDSKGNTALLYHAYNEAMVRELLADGGVILGATNMGGDTALKIARKDNCPACVALIEDALKQRAPNGSAPAATP